MIGCDFSEPMLDLAREKAAGRRCAGVRFEWADALQLPYDAGRFDAVTVGFGVRNLADLDRGLREMARVLRPGGGWSSSRSPSRAGRRSRPSTRSGSTGSCRSSAGSPPRPGGLLLPARVGARLPRPAGSGGEDGRGRAASEIRWTVLAGGIIAIHSGSAPGDPPLGRTAAGHRGPRRVEPLAAGAPGPGRADAARAGRRGTARPSAATPRRPWRPAASACDRCWSCSAPGRRAARRRSARRPRSS